MFRICSAAALDHTTTATLVIHHLRIALGDDVDVSGLIAEILDGVRTGGSVVHCVDGAGREYDVLVTPSTQAFIAYGAPTADDHAADGPWLTGADFDY